MAKLKSRELLFVFTTVSKKTDGKKIAQTLTRKKLAACVTILPQGESHYIWKGKQCLEKEFVLLIKTTAAKYKDLEKNLKAIHPYECPEIAATKIQKIYRPYAQWLRKNCS